MRLIKNTTELIGIKDQNIIISLVLKLTLISSFKQNLITLHH
ncbi:hypothetical protein HMPREF9192_1499, partial [Streptococcus vestibularis F0396]